MKQTILFIVVMAIAGSSGFLLHRYLNENESGTTTSPFIGTPAQEFTMKDTEGNIRNITDWRGKVVMINFWATWCPPCKKEIPLLIDIQNRLADRLQIVGIAMDEEQAVIDFSREIGINYPVIASEIEAVELGKRYGNIIGALPYTVIVDETGIISHTFMGELDKIEAEEVLAEYGLKL